MNRRSSQRRAERRQVFRAVPFVLAMLALLALSIAMAFVILDVLSAGRAYVAGESRWSRAKQSIMFDLYRYAGSGDPGHLANARENLQLPFNAMRGRALMLQPEPDFERGGELMEAAGIHPADTARMVRLLRYFRDFPYFSDAIETWRATDAWIRRLAQLADELERVWATGQPPPGQIESIRSELVLIDEALSERADEFSELVGRGGRWLTRTAAWSSLISALVIGGAVILVFVWAVRGMHASRHRFWHTFERAPVGIALLARDGTMVDSNDALGRFLDRDESELIGHSLAHFCDARDRGALQSLIAENSGPARSTVDQESRYVRPDGERVWGKLSVSPLSISNRGNEFCIAVVEDVSEARQLAAQLAYQAAHDQLTGLANRREFERSLSQVLQAAADDGTARHALGLIDLDQFKLVNDTFGHLAGDALLVRLADCIRQCLRDEDLLARLDGDEFGLILKDCSIDTAKAVADRLRDTIAQFRFTWEERPINISASIGIVAIDGATYDGARLMQQADLACYEAKEAGRNQVCVHAGTRGGASRHQEEMAWVNRVNEALSSGRLRFHAQLIEPVTGNEWHCELLVRLEDSDGRLHTAENFVEAAERFHVARKLDKWVVEHALESITRFSPSLPRIRTWHINLSGQSVDCETVLPDLVRTISESGLDPSRLCFEITESAAIQSLDQARMFFSVLRDLGCGIALDDFGKGLSTFDYLKQLPVDLVKIDGSFVRELAHSELDHAMVRSIHEIARIAGKRTIAESVESIELILRLKQIGIDFLQGHAIHNPESIATLKMPEPHTRSSGLPDY
ncbi:MAG: EAL domain-containing protein [Wenzhouxiangellaceae bacterium]|nr:EAL domain-containing protein [Wenzhouxiangellaceae bacterium]